MFERVTCCGAGCQAGHDNRETDRRKGHFCRAAVASEEGTAPANVVVVIHECILIALWDV
jgi:hypothetical protein